MKRKIAVLLSTTLAMSANPSFASTIMAEEGHSTGSIVEDTNTTPAAITTTSSAVEVENKKNTTDTNQEIIITEVKDSGETNNQENKTPTKNNNITEDTTTSSVVETEPKEDDTTTSSAIIVDDTTTSSAIIIDDTTTSSAIEVEEEELLEENMEMAFMPMLMSLNEVVALASTTSVATIGNVQTLYNYNAWISSGYHIGRSSGTQEWGSISLTSYFFKFNDISRTATLSVFGNANDIMKVTGDTTLRGDNYKVKVWSYDTDYTGNFSEYIDSSLAALGGRADFNISYDELCQRFLDSSAKPTVSSSYVSGVQRYTYKSDDYDDSNPMLEMDVTIGNVSSVHMYTPYLKARPILIPYDESGNRITTGDTSFNDLVDDCWYSGPNWYITESDRIDWINEVYDTTGKKVSKFSVALLMYMVDDYGTSHFMALGTESNRVNARKTSEIVFDDYDDGDTVNLTYGQSFTPGFTIYGDRSKSDVQFSSDDDSIATNVNGTITAKKAGDSTDVNFYFPSTSEYNSYLTTLYIRVSKADQTISGSDSFTKTYGDNGFTLNQSCSGGTLSYSSNNSSVASVYNSGLVIINGAGTATITVSTTGDSNYNSASKTITITVNKASQSISGSSSFTKTYGDNSFNLGQSCSGGTLTYSSNNTSVASVDSSGNVTVKGSGTATITVSTSGNSNYNSATKTVTVKVNAAEQSISGPSSFAKTYGNSEFDLEQSHPSNSLVYESSNTGVINVSNGGVATINGAGTVTITVTVNHPNYVSTSKTITITVNKANQSIYGDSEFNKTYGDSSFNLNQSCIAGTLSYSSNNTSVATVSSNGLVVIRGAGTATITVSTSGDSNYDSDVKTVTVNVAKKNSSTTATASLTKTFGDADFRISPTGTGSGSYSYSSNNTNVVSVNSDGSLHIVGAGTAVVTTTQEANNNYNASTATTTITVNKANQSISGVQEYNKTYGDSQFDLGLSCSAGTISYSTDNESVATVNTSGQVAIKGAGTARITATTPGDSNYNSATKTVTINVSKGSNTLTQTGSSSYTCSWDDRDSNGLWNPNGLSFTSKFGGSSTASVKSGVSNGYNVNGSFSIDNIGTTTFTVSSAASDNYTSDTKEITLTVTKGTDTISTSQDTYNVTYGDSIFDLGVSTASGEGTLSYVSNNTSVVTVNTLGKVTIKGAGETTITITSTDAEHYENASKTVTINVAKKDQTITGLGGTKTVTYGDSDFSLSYSSNGEGKVTYTSSNPNVISTDGTTNKFHIEGAGEAVITLTKAGTSNYNECTATKTVIVNKAKRVVKDNNSIDKNFTYSSTESWDFEITVTPETSNITYSSSNPDVVYFEDSSLPTFKTGTSGTATITAIVAGDNNYNEASISRTITVDKAVQTVSFNDSSANSGVWESGKTVNVAATASGGTTIVYSSSNTDVAYFEDSSSPILTYVKPGTTVITASTAGDGRYKDALATLSYTIDKREAELTSTTTSLVWDGGDKEHTFTLEGTGTITLGEVGDASIATIVDGKIRPVKPGTTTVQINYSGDDYYDSKSTTGTIVVTKAINTISTSQSKKEYYYNDVKGSNFRVPFSEVASYITTKYGDVMDCRLETDSSSIFYDGVTKEFVFNGDITSAVFTVYSPESDYYDTQTTSFTVELLKSQHNLEGTISDLELTYGDTADLDFTSSTSTITYTSSNENVVEVSGDGRITTTGTGTAKITATAKDDLDHYTTKTLERTVNVAKAQNVITVNDSPITKIYGDESFNLNASCVDGSLSYDSSDTSVVTVGILGDVIIRGAGTATITITSPETSNYKTNTKTISISINKADNIVTAPESLELTYGETLNIGATCIDGTITYEVIDDTVLEVDSTGKITPLKSGETKVKVISEDNRNYNTITKEVTVKVNKASQSISGTEEYTKTYGDSSFSLDATCVEGTLTYESSDSSVVSVTQDGAVTINKAGTATITVSTDGGDRYSGTSTTISITVNKAQDEITGTDSYSKVFNDDNFNLDHIATSGQVVKFRSGNEEVVKVSSTGEVTIIGAGNCEIEVYTEVNTNYEVTSKTVIIHVEKDDNEIMVSDFSKTYGDETFNLNASCIAGNLSYISNNTSVASVDNSGNVIINGAGSAVITVSTTGDKNYKPLEKTVTINVAKAQSKIKGIDNVEMYVGDTFEFSDLESETVVTLTSGNEDIVKVTDSKTIKALEVGTVSLTATSAEDSNYLGATKVVSIKAINRANDIETDTEITKTYNDDKFQLVATSDAGVTEFSLVEDTDVISVTSTGEVEILNAGTAKVKVSSTKYGYEDAEEIITIVVGQDDNSILVPETITATYGDTEVNIEALVTEGDISYSSSNTEVVKVDESGNITVVGAGEAVITTTVDETRNYKGLSVETKVVIEKAENVVTPAREIVTGLLTDDIIVSASAIDGVVTYTSSDTDIAEVSDTGEIIINGAGQVTITAYTEGTGNYKEASADITLIIGKVEPSFTVDETMGFDFKDNPKSLNITLTSPEGTSIIPTGKISFTSSDNGVVTVDNGNLTPVECGEAEVTVTVAEDKNYLSVSKTVKVKVSPITSTIPEVSPIAKVYGDESFNLNLPSECEFETSDSNVISVSAFGEVTINGAGTAVITVTIPPTRNYTGATSTIDVSITKADRDLSEIQNEVEFDYKSSIEMPEGYVYTSEDGAVIINGNMVTSSSAGDFTIKATYEETDNYKETSKNVRVKVNKINPELTVTQSYSKTYGDGEFNLEYSSESPVRFEVSNDVISVDEKGKVTVNKAGTATITVIAEETVNYKSTSEEISVVVNKADVDLSGITVEPVVFNYSDSYELPIKKGISYKVTSGNIKVTDNILSATAVGNYTVVAIYSGDANHNGFELEIPVEVKPAIGDLTVSDVGAYTYTGEPIKPKVEVYYRGTLLVKDVDYTVEYADNVKAGTATIMVKGVGNYKGLSQTATMVINPKDLTFDMSTKGNEVIIKVDTDEPVDIIIKVIDKTTEKVVKEIEETVEGGELRFDTSKLPPNTRIEISIKDGDYEATGKVEIDKPASSTSGSNGGGSSSVSNKPSNSTEESNQNVNPIEEIPNTPLMEETQTTSDVPSSVSETVVTTSDEQTVITSDGQVIDISGGKVIEISGGQLVNTSNGQVTNINGKIIITQDGQIVTISDGLITVTTFGQVITTADGKVITIIDGQIIVEDNTQDSDKVNLLFTAGSNIVVNNGRVDSLDTIVVIKDETAYVPLRYISETLGATIVWDGVTKTATVNYEDTSLEVNSELIYNSRLLVPLRLISETFGAEVGWYPNTKQVTVTR